MLSKGKIMNTRRIAVQLAIVAGLSVSLTGCGQIAMLRDKVAIKDAHRLYQIQDYAAAAEAYEETLADTSALDVLPELTVAYFYLGNSYDLQYRPGRRGEPENDALLEKAVENYRLASALIVDNPDMQRLSMQYLVATYGPDKLNDPGQAEPIIREMIDLYPGDMDNYFALSRLYEDSGQYEMAEQILHDARDEQPENPSVYLQMAAHYNRVEDFEQTMAALKERARIEPNNPEAYYTIATYFWEKAFRDFRLNDEEKAQYIAEGLAASDQALELKDDYHEAMTYKNILLRLQANATSNKAEQSRLIAEADDLRERAERLRRAQAAAPVAGG